MNTDEYRANITEALADKDGNPEATQAYIELQDALIAKAKRDQLKDWIEKVTFKENPNAWYTDQSRREV